MCLPYRCCFALKQRLFSSHLHILSLYQLLVETCISGAFWCGSGCVFLRWELTLSRSTGSRERAAAGHGKARADRWVQCDGGSAQPQPFSITTTYSSCLWTSAASAEFYFTCAHCCPSVHSDFGRNLEKPPHEQEEPVLPLRYREKSIAET